MIQVIHSNSLISGVQVPPLCPITIATCPFMVFEIVLMCTPVIFRQIYQAHGWVPSRVWTTCSWTSMLLNGLQDQPFPKRAPSSLGKVNCSSCGIDGPNLWSLLCRSQIHHLIYTLSSRPEFYYPLGHFADSFILPKCTCHFRSWWWSASSKPLIMWDLSGVLFLFLWSHHHK